MNPYDDNLDENNTPDDNAGYVDEYNQESDAVSERKVSADPLPSFKFYVFAPRGAQLAFEFDDKARPVARHRFECVHGPQGTEGQTFFADQRLYAPREVWTPEKDAQGRAVMRPMDAEELATSLANFDAAMGRIKAAFGLQAKFPKNKTAVALGAYIEQFDPDHKPTPQVVVGEVKRKNRNGFVSNQVQWNSLAGLEDPALDGKYKTALDEAKAKIAAQNKALEKGGNTRGGGNRTTRTATAPAID